MNFHFGIKDVQRYKIWKGVADFYYSVHDSEQHLITFTFMSFRGGEDAAGEQKQREQ